MLYRTLKSVTTETVSPDGSSSVTVPGHIFRTLLIGALKHKAVFDENYYLSKNSDVREAIKNGAIPGAAEHYYLSGYFEGRPPVELIINEKFYLDNNPDVFIAIRTGKVKSAQEHFEYSGFFEGRSPYSGFSLF